MPLINLERNTEWAFELQQYHTNNPQLFNTPTPDPIYLIFNNLQDYENWVETNYDGELYLIQSIHNTAVYILGPHYNYKLRIDKRFVGLNITRGYEWKQDVPNKTYTLDFPEPYATQYGNFANLGVKIEMSLLAILRHLKKQDPSTYYNNSNNKAHGLLWQHYLQSAYHKDKKEKERFIDVCSKFLRYEVMIITYNLCTIPNSYPHIMPKDALKLFHNVFGEAWIPHDVWEQQKANKYISYCERNKKWFWSSVMQHYFIYRDGVRSRSIIGNTPAFPITSHKDIQKCDQDGYYHEKHALKWIPEVEKTICPACKDKIKLENEPLAHYPIQDYHSHGSSWTFLIQRKQHKSDLKTLPMGIEIEMNAKLPETTRSRDSEGTAQSAAKFIYESQKEINPNHNNFYFEWDGSLNPGGFEMITHPMTMKYHQEFWPPLMEKMRMVALGWDTTGKGQDNKDFYGIHITSHRNYWSDLHLARFGYFLGSKHNRDFVHAIAQRAVIYGDNDKEIASDDKFKVTNSFEIDRTTKKLSGSNRDIIYLKDRYDLVELRMFRSTLNTESFLKNIEFVDAFRRWCMETGFSSKHEDFLHWLMSKKENIKTYPNLLSYLSRDKFACKRRPAFFNPFKEFLKGDFKQGQRVLFPPDNLSAEQLIKQGYEDEADILRQD